MYAAGRYNIGTDTDTIYEIGVGYAGSGGPERRNAFEIYTDGKVVAPELTSALINDSNTPTRVLITKEYADSNYGGGSGSSTFVGLNDTPADYTNAAGYTVKVNAAGDALEFVDDSTIDGGQF
jgi:hypothetical protein